MRVRFSKTRYHRFVSELGPRGRCILCLRSTRDKYICMFLYLTTCTWQKQGIYFHSDLWFSDSCVQCQHLCFFRDFLFGQSFGINYLGKLEMGEVCRAPRNSAVSDFWPPNRKTSEWKGESSVCSPDLSTGTRRVLWALVQISPV